jgi:formyl-CoA transferase
LAARNGFVDAPHATLGPVRQIASAMRFSRTPTSIRTAGPLLGEHSRAVLDELGWRRERVESLVAAGVVGVPA